MPITTEHGVQLRICRPAFQDFHAILPRYCSRSVLNRQLLKLRWWSPNEPRVVDLRWCIDDECGLFHVFVEPVGELATGVRVVFFEHSPDPQRPTLRILGGVRINEEFEERQNLVFCGRSSLFKERADCGEKMETMELKDFPNEAFRAILSIDSKQKELIHRYLECSTRYRLSCVQCLPLLSTR
jgi:hypothetical protein